MNETLQMQKPSDETNTKGIPYTQEQWRFILPGAALKELQLAFGDSDETAYRIKRAMELAIEHLMEELADDAECARIIEERVHPNTEWKTFDAEAYRQKRREKHQEAKGDEHG